MKQSVTELMEIVREYEKKKPPAQCVFRIFRNIYIIPVDHPGTDAAEDFYHYIDGMYGQFDPHSSELLLETSDRSKAEHLLDTLGNKMKRLILDRRKMPASVQIEQFDLRAQFANEEDSSLEDRLTHIIIDHEPDDPW